MSSRKKILFIFILFAGLLLSYKADSRLDTLSYLYSVQKIELDEAQLFRNYILKSYENAKIYTTGEIDSCMFVLDKVWNQYLISSFNDENLDIGILGNMMFFLKTYEKFDHGIHRIEDVLKNPNIEITHKNKFALIQHLSYFYNKVGDFYLSRHLLLDHLEEVYANGNDSELYSFLDPLAYEYNYLYLIDSNFKTDFEELNTKCFLLASMSGMISAKAYHYTLMAYFDKPENAWSYYKKAKDLIPKSYLRYEKKVFELYTYYTMILFDLGAHDMFYEALKPHIDSPLFRDNIEINLMLSRYYLEKSNLQKGNQHLTLALDLYKNEIDEDKKRFALLYLPELCADYGKPKLALDFKEYQNELYINEMLSETYGEDAMLRHESVIGNEENKIRHQKHYTLFLIITLIILGASISIIILLYNRKSQKNLLLENSLRKLKSKNNQLEIANSDIEKFAKTAVHDIKNPLYNIKGTVHLLKKNELMDMKADSKKYMEYIDTCINSAIQILRNIINHSSLNQSLKMPSAVDFRQCLDECLIMLNKEILDTKAEIQYQGSFPVLNGYPELIQQLILNLLSNSLKFRSKNKPPKIKIFCTEYGDEYHIHFSDNGIGIPNNDLESIFELFSRGENSLEYQGAGLGLSIVKKIIDIHEAEIEIRNNYDAGVTFIVIIKKEKTTLNKMVFKSLNDEKSSNI